MIDPAGQVHPPKKQSVRILILEDEPDHATLMSKALGDLFQTVPMVASTREEGLNLLEKTEDQLLDRQALVLLDLYFPDRRTGLDLLGLIRQRLPLVPVIVFSGSAEENDIIDTYQLGANCYLVKPMLFDDWPDSFRALAEYWLEAAALPYQE